MAQGSSNPTTDLKKVAGTAVDVSTGNASAGTQRIVIASNQPAIPITDNGGSLTIDGTVELGATSLAALENISVTIPGTVDLGTVSLTALETISVTQSGTWNVGLNAGTNAIGKLAANSGVDIGDVDVLSVIPGVGATNLGKQTDSAAGATDTGVAILAIRDDALTTLTPVDGDYTRFRVNSIGRLWTSATIDAALPTGTNSIGSVTLNAETTKVIGTVNIAASQTLGTVTTVSTVTNLAQLGGVAVAMNTGVRSTGTQRVTIATDDIIKLDSDETHDGVAGTTGVLLIGYGSAVTPTATSADGDATRLWVNRSGALITDGYAKIGTATALGALNANMTIALGGAKSVGMTITTTATPVGMVLTPYVSFDGGTNWVAVTFDNPAGDKTSTVTNAELVAGAMRTIMLAGGATHVKVQATSWTSGSATINLSATETADSSVFFAASNNTANRPPATAQVGGWDGTNLRALTTNTSGHLAVQDGGNSLTVDAPVATPVFVRLSSGSAAVDTIPVSIASVPSHAVTNAGTFAVQAASTQVLGSAATRWYTQLSDGTNSPAIKAASTAAAATDPALVVAISPNNTVPVSIASVPSHAVTNAGTFAVQVTSAPTTAVTGTFWQATQPVSGPLTDTQLRATAVPVSLASLPALATGTNTIGAVNIAAGQTLATVTTVGAVTAITNALPAGNNNIGDVDVASVIPGVGTTNLGKAVNDVAGATDVGVAALVLRDDALAAISPADGDYTRLRVNSTGRLWTTTDIEGAVTNAANSSTTVLAVSAVFTGTSVDVSAYAQIRVNVFASHASATNGLSMQFSPDGTNWDHTSVFTVPAASDVSYLLPVTHKFFRVVYTNGATLLTAFRLTTALITNATTGSIKELSSSIDRSDFALSTRSVIAGPATPGTTIALNEVTVKSASTAAAATDTALVVTHHPSSSGVKIWDGTSTAAVKAAGIRPTTSDPSLVVQIAPQNEVRIRPSEVMRDAVDKLRVSTPQSLIDTDFEYGIQPTKWESITLLNNRPTSFVDVTVPLTGITGITASGTTVTIAGSGFALTVGQPIFITGTLDQANVDGWWIIATATATSITFLVNTAPIASLYDSTKTYVYGGTFFTGSNIVLDTAQTLTTVVIAGTAGQFTCAAATLALGDIVRISGVLGGTGTITGYVDPSIYYIIATNGTTSFTLSATPGGAAITTTAGTPTGLTYVNTSIAVSGTTVTIRTSNSHGIRVGNKMYVTGTTGTTGGPVNGTFIVTKTPTNNLIQYTTTATVTGAVTYTGTTTLYPAQPGYVDHRPYDGGVQFSNETAYHGYQDIRQTRRYFRYQSGKGIQFSTGTILKPPFYVDQLTSSGTTVTVTTKYPHGLLTGSTVVVSGASPAAYNGTFTVTGTTTLTITYTALSAPGTTPATGFPITVSPGTWYGGSNRIGMFDNQNGFFYEHDGQTMYAVLRKSVDQLSGKVAVTAGGQLVTGTGTFFGNQLKPGDSVVIRGKTYRVEIITSDTQMYIYPEYRGVTTSNTIVTKTVETRIAQSSWNLDRCNGAGGATNPSGFNLDLTRMQMFYMDYSWYGAGAVRFGFKDQNGEIIVAHRITNSNVNYEAYMRSGNLPARYETNTLAPKTYLTATLAAATTTGGTITVADTSTFPPTGTVILSQPVHQGGAIEYITYTAKTATTLTIGARVQTNGVATAQTFTYSATAPIFVEAYIPQAAQTLSHWGSSVIMDGRYDDDKSLVFNTGMVTAISNKAIGARTPLLSIRLAPTVDNGQTGLLGAREIINRMQLTLRSIGTYTTGSAFRIEVLLNARVTAGTFAPVGGSSLSQICLHAGTETVSGGESMFAFYATANDTNSLELDQVRDLGNSILGGGTSNAYPTTNLNKYPDGPDIVTVIAIPLTAATNSIVARLNWSEAQA